MIKLLSANYKELPRILRIIVYVEKRGDIMYMYVYIIIVYTQMSRCVTALLRILVLHSPLSVVIRFCSFM